MSKLSKMPLSGLCRPVIITAREGGGIDRIGYAGLRDRALAVSSLLTFAIWMLAGQGFTHALVAAISVMIIACPDAEHFYLVREYCAGTHDYQLGFPKGLIDPGEDVMTAANRELKEEIGFGARRFIALKSLALAPGYFNATMHIVLAFDLYAESLEGDEPEPLELVPWCRSHSDALLQQADFTEARSVAALLLAQQYLEANPDVFEQTA